MPKLRNPLQAGTITALVVVVAAFAGCMGDSGARPDVSTPIDTPAQTSPAVRTTQDASGARANASVDPSIDYEARYEAWIRPTFNGTPHQANYSFPVNESARSATLRVEVVSQYPIVGRLPRETADLIIRAFAPSGAVLAKAERDARADKPFVALELAQIDVIGNYTLEVAAYGGSDGSSLGDRYIATIGVDY